MYCHFKPIKKINVNKTFQDIILFFAVNNKEGEQYRKDLSPLTVSVSTRRRQANGKCIAK